MQNNQQTLLARSERAFIQFTYCKYINLIILQLSSAGGEREEICSQCWECVINFHTFYERVYNAHQERRTEVKDVPIEFCGETVAANPLAFGTEMDALAEGFFSAGDVKVEVNELEPLTKLEILEDPVLAEPKSNKRSCTTDHTTTTAKRRIKKEPLTFNSDSDGDIPLSEFLPEKPVAPVGETSVKTRQGLRRSTRRGRPPKIQPASLKKELDSDHDNDVDFVTPEAVLGTEDSESSSDSDSHSGESLPDIEPLERYADIPKRVVVKPKKYRKRPKPLVPPVRMSREEIEKRKAQQDAYDEIIFDFFKKLPCHICQLLVPNFGDMRRHLRMSHDIESGFIICCGRKFHVRKGLADHVLVHKNPEHFKCTQCGRAFPDSKTLETHELTHTNPPGSPKEKQTYQCDKCPKHFTTKAAHEYHNVSKHVPKSDFKYTCLECNKK